MTPITLGELFAQRVFKKDERVGGKGLEPGQYAAKQVSKTDAILSYVDPYGNACIMPVEKKEGEWFHREVLLCVGPNFAAVRQLPRSFALTDEMVRALTKRKAPDSSKTT